ncbi:MAG: hypothetical protein AB7O88_04120, partial [Reyranellaceae bacterium]
LEPVSSDVILSAAKDLAVSRSCAGTVTDGTTAGSFAALRTTGAGAPSGITRCALELVEALTSS